MTTETQMIQKRTYERPAVEVVCVRLHEGVMVDVNPGDADVTSIENLIIQARCFELAYEDDDDEPVPTGIPSQFTSLWSDDD